jgi:hypothetical protein
VPHFTVWERACDLCMVWRYIHSFHFFSQGINFW